MKVIAHRGASGEFPENSLLAFEQAIIQQADGIELDVQFHEESEQFILLHDIYVDKVTSKHGHFNQFSITELLQFPLGKNQYLTTLDEALKLIKGRVKVNIELKATTDNIEDIDHILFKLKTLIEHANRSYSFSNEDFIISSFNHVMVARSKLKIPVIETAALIAHCPNDYAEFASTLACDGINPAIECINQKLVNDAKRKNFQVWVYTVDRKEDIEECIALGVDAIFTNFPKQTRKIINEYLSD